MLMTRIAQPHRILGQQEMGQSTPKRHHYIPRILLQCFADSDPYLHCHKRGDDNVYKATPDNAFMGSLSGSDIGVED